MNITDIKKNQELRIKKKITSYFIYYHLYNK